MFYTFVVCVPKAKNTHKYMRIIFQNKILLANNNVCGVFSSKLVIFI